MAYILFSEGRPARWVSAVQALSLGLGDRWEKVKDSYAHANRALGDIVKVTPSSKVGASRTAVPCMPGPYMRGVYLRINHCAVHMTSC